jgi:hypothetical protein
MIPSPLEEVETR